MKTQQAAIASTAALVLDYLSDFFAASAAKSTGYMVLQCEVRVLEVAATAAAIWEGSPFCSFGSHVFEWCWVNLDPGFVCLFY